MAIYEKPVRVLIREMAADLAGRQGHIFAKDDALCWFSARYPKTKEGTISAHLIRFSTNAPSRLHYNAKPDEDLLFQIDGSHFRLYEPATDPTPIHSKTDRGTSVTRSELLEAETASEFAYEHDLRDFL